VQVNGDTHRHLHLLSRRNGDWSVCGVMNPALRGGRFSLICEVCGIEVLDEPQPLPVDATQAEAE
jgi:hypothetical protein